MASVTSPVVGILLAIANVNTDGLDHEWLKSRMRKSEDLSLTSQVSYWHAVLVLYTPRRLTLSENVRSVLVELSDNLSDTN